MYDVERRKRRIGYGVVAKTRGLAKKKKKRKKRKKRTRKDNDNGD
jgi:hypothetical protein